MECALGRVAACRGRVVLAATVEQVAGYRDLLRTPGVARIMAAQLTARFPNGMTSLAILLHIEYVTGSYGAAGLVLAATSVGQAIAGPVTSRWMGVWGMRRVLTTTLVICAFAITAIALFETIVPVYMVLGLIAGLSTPPVQSAVRTIYPKMVNSRQLTPLFSFDASLQEVIWIVAPVVITVVATQVGTVQALLLIVVILISGGAWFILSPEVGRVRIPRSRRSIGKVLAKPQVLLATVIGFLLIGACAAVEAGVVATFDARRSRGRNRARDLLDRKPRRRPVVRPHPDRPVGDGAPPGDPGVRALVSRSSR